MTSSPPRRDLSPLCVYCGSAPGARPVYAHAARDLGREMARRGIALVYGGGRAGLMGSVADGVLEAGGRVTGVITRQLMDKELGHTGVHELRVVDSMHERKKAMADAARGFVALPGGVGTLDELFEIMAWAQLALHDHPVGVLNAGGFFDPLVELMEHMERQRFLRVPPREAMIVAAEPGPLLDAMAAAPPRTLRPHGAEGR
jgi:uncharacterized protein (TIGR00730 family)